MCYDCQTVIFSITHVVRHPITNVQSQTLNKICVSVSNHVNYHESRVMIHNNAMY